MMPLPYLADRRQLNFSPGKEVVHESRIQGAAKTYINH